MKIVLFDLWDTLAKKPYSIVNTLIEQFNLSYDKSLLRPYYEDIVQTKEWKSNEAMASALLEVINVAQTKEHVAFVVETIARAGDGAFFIEGQKELLEELKGKYTLALISNTTKLELLRADAQLHMLSYFDHIFLSYETGLIKPHPALFLQVLKVLNTHPSDILFVDDTFENISRAQRMGMHTHHFKDTATLRKELQRH